MYDILCMMYDVWCMMYDVWCTLGITYVQRIEKVLGAALTNPIIRVVRDVSPNKDYVCASFDLPYQSAIKSNSITEVRSSSKRLRHSSSSTLKHEPSRKKMKHKWLETLIINIRSRFYLLYVLMHSTRCRAQVETDLVHHAQGNHWCLEPKLYNCLLFSSNVIAPQDCRKYVCSHIHSPIVTLSIA